MSEYIKIPSDFFESEPIRSLTIKCKTDSDSIIVFYLHLLCETYKSGKRGVFSIANIVLTDEVIHAVFNYDDIKYKLDVLESFGLIKREERRIDVFKFWVDAHNRNSDQYKRWRTDVFKRDNFQCQKCGSSKNIQAHHIKTWKNSKELRYVVSNGITLCRKCHLEAHGGCWRNG